MDSKYWKSDPPTYEEWRKSGGWWWMRFKISDEEQEIDPETGDKYTWDEIWFNTVVYITAEFEDLSRDLLEKNPKNVILHCSPHNIIDDFKIIDGKIDNEQLGQVYWQLIDEPKD